MAHTQNLLLPEGTRSIVRNLVERINRDRRTKDIERIALKEWDLVIDSSCYFPNDLEEVLNNMKVAPRRWVLPRTKGHDRWFL